MSELKSYCLHVNAEGKAKMREPDNGEDGLYYNANDADVLIESQQQRISELEHQLNKYNNSDLVWFERHEIKGLDREQGGVIDLNMLRRDVAEKAYRQAVIDWCIDKDADIDELEKLGCMKGVNNSAYTHASKTYPE